MFIRTWLAPMAVEEGRWARLSVAILGLEFILVHSSAFVGVIALLMVKKDKPIKRHHGIGLLLALTCFYMVFLAPLSLAFDDGFICWMFCWVMVSRLFTAFLDGESAAIMMILRPLIVHIPLCLFSVLLAIFVRFPRGGLTPEVIEAVYSGEDPDTIGYQNPQQVLLAGVVYFGLLGLLECVPPLNNKLRKLCRRARSQLNAPADAKGPRRRD